MNEPDPAGSGPGLLRRLASITYDGLLLFSVLFLATAIVLPLNAGRAIPAHQPLYDAYLLGVSFAYFGWFWTHGGQTLGMKAWRVRLRSVPGPPVSWWQALARFSGAIVSWLPLGMGFWWCLLDPTRCAWHDRWSRTRLVHEPHP